MMLLRARHASSVTAKEQWRNVVRWYGVESLAEREAEVRVAMRALNEYLTDDACTEVIREERMRLRILNPRHFLGFRHTTQ
jgi:hypothetical protein